MYIQIKYYMWSNKFGKVSVHTNQFMPTEYPYVFKPKEYGRTRNYVVIFGVRADIFREMGMKEKAQNVNFRTSNTFPTAAEAHQWMTELQFAIENDDLENTLPELLN